MAGEQVSCPSLFLSDYTSSLPLLSSRCQPFHCPGRFFKSVCDAVAFEATVTMPKSFHVVESFLQPPDRRR